MQNVYFLFQSVQSTLYIYRMKISINKINCQKSSSEKNVQLMTAQRYENE